MSTKEQMKPEQIILVQELVELFTPYIGDDEVGMLYRQMVEQYQESIETGIFVGQIHSTVEDEHEYQVFHETIAFD